MSFITKREAIKTDEIDETTKNTKITKPSKNKIKRTIFVFLFLLLVLISIPTSYSIYLNNKFTQGMKYDKNLAKAKYIYEDSTFQYKYKKSNLIELGTFASVSTIEDTIMYMDESEQTIKTKGTEIILFIWPEFLGGYKYGVMLFNNDDRNIDRSLYIDKDINIVAKDGCLIEQADRDLINEYKEDITMLMEAAQNKWEL